MITAALLTVLATPAVQAVGLLMLVVVQCARRRSSHSIRPTSDCSLVLPAGRLLGHVTAGARLPVCVYVV